MDIANAEYKKKNYKIAEDMYYNLILVDYNPAAIINLMNMFREKTHSKSSVCDKGFWITLAEIGTSSYDIRKNYFQNEYPYRNNA